jgi:putative membrane protein
MGVGGWLLMSVFWVGLIALVVWGVINLFNRSDGRSSIPELSERPDEILDRRLAAGEIDAATYDALNAKMRDARAAR